MQWNFGDILDAIEPVIDPQAPACIHGERHVSWGEAGMSSNNLARALIATGARPSDKVAFYTRNCPEYLIGLAAAFKARLTHVNVNYRYTPAEVGYILDNADARIVMYAAEFGDAVAAIRPTLPLVEQWIEIGPADTIRPFATAFDTLCQTGDGSPLTIARAGSDQLLLYTGGTTGMPKGVIWTHHDIREIARSLAAAAGPVPADMAGLVEQVRTARRPKVLIPPPLMHGTALLRAINVLLAGGCVVTLEGRSFDATEMLDAIDRHGPEELVLVGDSFGRPLLDALDAAAGRHAVGDITAIVSSGVMWSVEVKRGLLRHMPRAGLLDGFSSSEALGMGLSLMTADSDVPTASFALSDRCRVFDEHDRPVTPGSGVPGILAISGPNPIGYYKDEGKTARTFRTIDGIRYSIPGDWCLVEADGTLTLLGRGSACINSAGEKVFPEEVEEALKTHDSVEDALVIGLPDPKWGQAITAVVALRPKAAFDEQALRDHVRTRLAGYKVPKRVIVADRPLRTNNGKADYPAARAVADAALEPGQPA